MACLRFSAMTRVAELYILCALLPWLANSTCFYPNGDTASDKIPCNTDGSTSVCCSENFECLSNGLCVDIRYPDWGRLLRGSCTDKDGGAPCPQYCLDTWPQGDAAMHYCGNGKYCCTHGDCCEKGEDLLDLGEPQVIATAGVEGSFVAATSKPLNPSPQTTQQQQAPPKQTEQPEQKTQPKETQQTQQQQQPQQSQQPQQPQQSVTQQQPQPDPSKEPAGTTQPNDAPSPATTKTAAPKDTGDSTAAANPSSKHLSNSNRPSSSDESLATSASTGRKANPSSPRTVTISQSGSAFTTVLPPSTVTQDAAAPTSSSPKKSSTTAIGIGVGVAVGIVLLIGIAVAIFFFRRRRGKRFELDATEMTPTVMRKPPSYSELGSGGDPEGNAQELHDARNEKQELHGQQVHELEGHWTGAEMSAEMKLQELDSKRRSDFKVANLDGGTSQRSPWDRKIGAGADRKESFI